MAAQNKKRITIEQLARMIKRDFDAAASKDDLTALEKRADRKITALETKIEYNFKLLKTDIQYIKSYTEKTFKAVDGFLVKLTKLEQEQTMMQVHLNRLEKRIEQIEAKVGI